MAALRFPGPSSPKVSPVNSPKVDELEKVRVSPFPGWESPRNCGFPDIWFRSCSGNCGFLRFPRRIRENYEKNCYFGPKTAQKTAATKKIDFLVPKSLRGFPNLWSRQDTFRKLGFPQQNCEETSRLVLFQCQKHCRSLLLQFLTREAKTSDATENSSWWARTTDLSVNSRALCQLSQ